MTDEEEMKEFAQRIKSMGIENKPHGLKPCPFCGFEEASMGYDRTVACGNCGAKGPWDKDAYDGAGDEQEMWNHRSLPKWERRSESPETDRMMEADRHHWDGEEMVSITAYMRMFSMACEMEAERDAYRRQVSTQSNNG